VKTKRNTLLMRQLKVEGLDWKNISKQEITVSHYLHLYQMESSKLKMNEFHQEMTALETPKYSVCTEKFPGKKEKRHHTPQNTIDTFATRRTQNSPP